MTLHIFNARHGEYLPDASLLETVYEAEWNEEATPAEHAEAVIHFAREKGIDLDETRVALSEAGDDVEWVYWIAVSDENREAALQSLLTEISEPPSGDDDTFDYWPSGVALARALIADDHDERAVAEAVAHVLDAKGYDADELGV